MQSTVCHNSVDDVTEFDNLSTNNNNNDGVEQSAVINLLTLRINLNLICGQ